MTVPCASLEEVMARLFPEECDLLKMDCEGAEFDILLTSPAAVVRRIHRFALEYHDWHPHNHVMLADRLTSLGYRVKTTPNAVHAETGYLYAWKEELQSWAGAPGKSSPESGRAEPGPQRQ